MIMAQVVGLAMLPKIAAFLMIKNPLGETIRAKLNTNPSRSGTYGMGTKLSLQQVMDVENALGLKTLRLLEIKTIIVTSVDTKLVNIERISKKNTAVMTKAYPGLIEWNSDSVCESRRSVVSHLFRNEMEVYKTLHSILQAICKTQENSLPYRCLSIDRQVDNNGRKGEPERKGNQVPHDENIS